MIVANANKVASKTRPNAGAVAAKRLRPLVIGNAGTEISPNDYLQVWPVSRRVNSSRASGGDLTLIDRVTMATVAPVDPEQLCRKRNLVKFPFTRHT